ncbi:hypothetical protein [Helicobacter rodentium]|nr:hypothetical protein [Helicobacter rodentium]
MESRSHCENARSIRGVSHQQHLLYTNPLAFITIYLLIQLHFKNQPL